MIKMILLKVKGQIERLIDRYEILIKEASTLCDVNRSEAFEKLREASKIEAQIEELKIARNN